MVVLLTLQPELEATFHADSYSCRPRKSAIQAVEKARERCWRYDWVLDLDIKGLRLHLRTTWTLEEPARQTERVLVGWINYYGSYYRSGLYRVFSSLDRAVTRWGMRKYKKLKGRWSRAGAWLNGIQRRQPGLLAHRRLPGAPAGR